MHGANTGLVLFLCMIIAFAALVFMLRSFVTGYLFARKAKQAFPEGRIVFDRFAIRFLLPFHGFNVYLTGIPRRRNLAPCHRNVMYMSGGTICERQRMSVTTSFSPACTTLDVRIPSMGVDAFDVNLDRSILGTCLVGEGKISYKKFENSMKRTSEGFRFDDVLRGNRKFMDALYKLYQMDSVKLSCREDLFLLKLDGYRLEDAESIEYFTVHGLRAFQQTVRSLSNVKQEWRDDPRISRVDWTSRTLVPHLLECDSVRHDGRKDLELEKPKEVRLTCPNCDREIGEKDAFATCSHCGAQYHDECYGRLKWCAECGEPLDD